MPMSRCGRGCSRSDGSDRACFGTAWAGQRPALPDGCCKCRVLVAPAVGRPSGSFPPRTPSIDDSLRRNLLTEKAKSCLQHRRMSSNRLRLGRRTLLGRVYVLTTRCTQNARWFESSEAVEIVVMHFRRSDQSRCTRTLAWVVMPDHIHWMFELRERTLAYVARRFKSSSALALNRFLGRQGKVWQPGYHDHCLRDDAALIRHARYIMANPVRAGLSERIGDYPHAWCRWPLAP